MKTTSLTRGATAAVIAITMLPAVALAHPDNSQTLRFTLYCNDGNTWDASFNGGPSAFTIDGDGLFIWKQIEYVTPDQVSGTIHRGIQGFSAAPLVVCTYTGAQSGNAYTVTGFYPPAD
jgi:hypothetical protein